MRRVDEAIRQVIGDAVAGELKDPRVGFVTVTDVRTSADLSQARVYVSVLGDAGGASSLQERLATLDGLRSAHGFLQARVGRELLLRQEGLAKEITHLSWRAQTRLHHRYKHLTGVRHKLSPVAATALGRELSGFVWAIGQIVSPRPPKP